MKTVGVIDVGSNTIKLLVAQPGKTLPAEKVSFVVEETRIGEGMTGHPPVIDEQAIERGAAAIARLTQAASECDTLCIVATSAVRDASNKQAFVNAVEKASNHELRILSGEEEAAFIGLALRCDPALKDLSSYTLFDLGGGSLECIQFTDHKVSEAQSLQLGSVRLASLLLEDRKLPLPQDKHEQIAAYVKQSWGASKFAPDSSPSEIAVLTGGSAKHLAESLTSSQRESGISFQDFSEIVDRVCSLTFDQRIKEYNIPPNRADIFPTAMVTLKQSLSYLGCSRIFFSDYNLRFGVATMLLQQGEISRIALP
ncbi:Ppx/GppA phosphatase family protein [Pelagicoccus mobilis]|uniref:Ppx/GppA phosphatase N-terminal domain-containing protein n=1 Tax=Pelagicoccus mobilis TaxID=415221 RepID=A0A934S604_9BACT|nr:hypothetical protein [Pelagicoccus mobilis]MBK1880392.1 hypothetical protein [Pelagicoccus mobilis]